MNIVDKLILKDVRCFEGRNEFNIRPLTFLVGENSTGKSTALGCFQALSDFYRGREGGGIDFNKEPYQMGAFADIARKTRNLAESFELGFEYEDRQYILTLEAQEDGSEPIIRQIRNIFDDDGEIIFEVKRQQNDESFNKLFVQREEITFNKKEKNKFLFSIENIEGTPSLRYRHFYGMDFLLPMIENQMRFNEKFPRYKNLENHLYKTLEKRQSELLSLVCLVRDRATYSFAPIRFKPERTYNPLKETLSPEGGEMPMILKNLSSKADKNEWLHLKKELETFGKASGLFDDIGVRNLGRFTNDPFQLQIKVRGSKRNLMDVGYGISQILPILVRIWTKYGRFLLQQPEVHLHPKGQAELTSLLVSLIKKERSFIVETHSDAMINRARIEIMNKKLNPEDVSLIYLEPAGNKVKVHNISFDEQANMIGVPGSYRDFFLKEGDRLLGFKD